MNFFLCYRDVLISATTMKLLVTFLQFGIKICNYGITFSTRLLAWYIIHYHIQYEYTIYYKYLLINFFYEHLTFVKRTYGILNQLTFRKMSLNSMIYYICFQVSTASKCATQNCWSEILKSIMRGENARHLFYASIIFLSFYLL